MSIAINQILEKFNKMQKVANETLSATPDALIGVDSLPGSEHDEKVPEGAKKPDKEATQGLPAGSNSAAGAVSGGDAKILNETKLEVDQPLLNPEKKPLVTDDALSAKTADAHLQKIVGDLLNDLKGDAVQKQASCEKTTEKKSKEASMKNKIELNSDMIAKLAAAQAAFDAGRQAAQNAMAKGSDKAGALDKSASCEDKAEAARQIIKRACIKAAQDEGLSAEDAAAAADGAMADAGIAGPAASADAGAQIADAAAQLPPDTTEEELGEAIVDLVQSGELDPDTAKAIVDEIAGGEEAAAVSEDQAAEIIANGIQSGEITPEQAQAIAASIESGDNPAAASDPAAAGAADAAAAVQEAKDEAAGAAAAQEAMKQAAATVRNDAMGKIASAVAAKRNASAPGGRILAKVAEHLERKQVEVSGEKEYIDGFCKQAEAMGVDPRTLARYILENQSK